MALYPIRHEKNERKGLFTGDGKLALGVTIGAMGAILSYLAIDFVARPSGSNEYLQLAPLVISLLVATTSTYLAANALLEQRRTREAGTDPVIIAHLGQREDARELITFNISNIGAGAALNVLLDVERPHEDTVQRRLITNIFNPHHPFAVIPQDKSVEFNFALGWDLLGDSPLPPFRAKVSYEDLAGGLYESAFMIDVRELKAVTAHKSPQMRMVVALEAMAKKM